MEVAFDAEGRLLALRGQLCHDHGACTPYGVALAYNAGTNVIGPYVLPAYRLDINCASPTSCRARRRAAPAARRACS